MSIHSEAAEAASATSEDTASSESAVGPSYDLVTSAAKRLSQIGVKGPQAVELYQYISQKRDCIVTGSEHLFLSAAIVIPTLYQHGLIIAIMPSLETLRRARQMFESLELRVVSFDLAPTKSDKREIWETLDRGEADVILVSPGRLASARFRDRLSRREISLIVIAQAQMMSPWSNRFTPTYRQVGGYLAGFKDVPKIAHIWSTQNRVAHDIQKLLDLKSPHIGKLNCDEELTPHIEGRSVSNDVERIAIMNEFVPRHSCQGVIHVGSLKLLHDTKTWLESLGETPEVIRPGLDEFTTQRIRTGFENGEVRIVISQGPFLSTLERAPGLEFVVFNGMPESIELLGQELFSHETASPLACQIIASERDFFHHRFAIDKNYPDALMLRACFKGIKDAFGSNSFVPPETLKAHTKIATPFPEEDIAQCLSVLHREGLLEHVLDSTTDQIMVKLTPSGSNDSDFWHEYPLRKLDQIGRLERTRDFLASAGDKGKQLRSILRI